MEKHLRVVNPQCLGKRCSICQILIQPAHKYATVYKTSEKEIYFCCMPHKRHWLRHETYKQQHQHGVNCKPISLSIADEQSNTINEFVLKGYYHSKSAAARDLLALGILIKFQMLGFEIPTKNNEY